MDETTTLWSLRQIAEYVSVSPSTASRYSRRVGFPPCHKLSERTLRWRADEVITWVENRAVAPRGLPDEIPDYLLKAAAREALGRRAA